LGAERALSWLCDSRRLDRAARGQETRLAARVVAHAASSARRSASSLLCPGLGRSGAVCALVVSAHRAAGLASVVAHPYGWDLSARSQCLISTAAQLRTQARAPARRARQLRCTP